MNELQAGFTKGRRFKDNVFLVKYCIDDSKRRKQKLVLVAIDFSKAFDSINRCKLINKNYEVLQV